MCLERRAPRRARVGKEYVYVIRGFCYFRCEPLDLGDLGEVGRDRDSFGARTEVRESIKGVDGFVAGCGFAGGYIDSAAAGLQKTAVAGSVLQHDSLS